MAGGLAAVLAAGPACTSDPELFTGPAGIDPDDELPAAAGRADRGGPGGVPGLPGAAAVPGLRAAATLPAAGVWGGLTPEELHRLAGAGPDVAAGGGGVMAAGTVYLLHFDQPYKHARHYVGWTARTVRCRLAEHEAGRGARLLAVVRAAGIGWQLARCWPGGRARERQLKRQGGHARKCPLCGVRPRALPRNRDGSLSRSRTTDAQKAAAGVMTAGAAGRAHRAAPRRGHRQAGPPARAGPAGRRPVGGRAARRDAGSCLMKRYALWALVILAAWWVIQDPDIGRPSRPRARRGFLTHAAHSLSTLASSS